ncbi:gp53-like domain-containing protein [Phascolarctobacterium faecium]|uniref:gp53-like domain-containing protein n=1 Tax=Phascolarctobacterium faecium TaxID=33025 RepID=UPI003AF31A95
MYKLASSIRVSARVPSSANFIKIRASLAFLGIFSQPFYYLQWGYSNSETTVNFPMTFGSVLIILGTKRAIQYEYTVAATDITNTKFYLSTRNNSGSSRVIACNWIALGS